jgi:hypothetical protein
MGASRAQSSAGCRVVTEPVDTAPPDSPGGGDETVSRPDIDTAGCRAWRDKVARIRGVTLHYDSRIHHIGVDRAQAYRRLILLVADSDVADSDVRTPSKIVSRPAASQQVAPPDSWSSRVGPPALMAPGDETDRGSGLSPQECVATTQAPADSPTCQHLHRACIRCSDPVRSGSHHLLVSLHGGPVGLGRSARCVLCGDLAWSGREGIGPRGAGERPVPTRATGGGHVPPATTWTVDVAARTWPPACEPVAAVARPPRRRSPRRRPSRAAPDPPAPRRGTRPSLPGLISP